MPVDKFALTLADLTARGCGSRTFLYNEIGAGRLIASKIGKRTVVLPHNLEKWLSSLPEMKVAG